MLMTLHDAHGKNVRVTLLSGDIYEGLAYDYTSAEDNDPDPESISIDHFELFAPEIESIELIG